MNLLQRSVLGTVLVLIITLCLGYVFNKQAAGVGVFDLTSNHRYSLTQGTRDILDKLQRPLTIKLYYAKTAVNRTGYNQLALFNNHYFYVRDLLRTMARYSKGKLTLEEYDPRPFSDAAEEADTFGIRAFPLGQQTNEVFYFGIALTSDAGAREVIEFLHPSRQGSVEYEIVNLIDRATHRKKSKIGIMSSLKVVGEKLTPQMMQMRQMLNQPVQQSWAVVEKLKQQKYEVTEVAKDVDKIPDDIAYLLVIHPKDFTDKALFAIDQFVMRGGKAVFFVDPYCQVDMPPRNPRNPYAGMSHNRASNVNKLLEAWGLRMEEGKFAGDHALARRVPARDRRSMVPYIGWVVLDKDKKCFSESEVASEGLDKVMMLYPGALKRVEGRGTQVASLLQTTATGNLWAASSWELGGPMGPDPRKVNEKLEDGTKPLMLAAMITGKFKSAFPGGLPGEKDKEKKDEDKADKDGDGKPDSQPTSKPTSKPQEPEKEQEKKQEEAKKPDHLLETAKSNVVVVVADADMIADGVAYQQTFMGPLAINSNAALLFNVLEFLSGSEDLINVRSRGSFSRKFDRIVAIRDAAEKKTSEQVGRIEKEIEDYQAELRKLQGQADEKNVGALNSEALAKKKRTEKKIKDKRWELRKLKSEEREEIEAVKATARNINLWVIPGLIAVIGFILWIIRLERRRTQVLGGD